VLGHRLSRRPGWGNIGDGPSDSGEPAHMIPKENLGRMMSHRKTAFPAFLLIAVGVIAISAWLARSVYFAEQPDLLGRAISLDLAILLPGFYWIMATRLGWPRLSVIPVFIVSTLIAHAVLPREHSGFLGVIEFLVVPLELFALVYVLRKAQQVTRAYRQASATSAGGVLGGDFVEALESVLERTSLPSRLAQIALTEASVFHYGLLAWGRRREYGPQAEAFSYHIKNGYGVIVGGFIVVIVIETALVHLALLPRVPVLAWILAASSVYGILFLIADFKAAVRRPVLVDGEHLHVRTAFRWRCSIPLAWIETAETSSRDIDDKKGLLDAKIIAGHNVVLKLRRHAEATGMYGFTKRFDRVALSVDEPARLVQSIERRTSEEAN